MAWSIERKICVWNNQNKKKTDDRMREDEKTKTIRPAQLISHFGVWLVLVCVIGGSALDRRDSCKNVDIFEIL